MLSNVQSFWHIALLNRIQKVVIYGVSCKEREGKMIPTSWIDLIIVMMNVPLEGLEDQVENCLSG